LRPYRTGVGREERLEVLMGPEAGSTVEKEVRRKEGRRIVALLRTFERTAEEERILDELLEFQRQQKDRITGGV
jgi:hypothetical protein